MARLSRPLAHQDPKRLRDMSRCALQVGKPDATLEIAKVLSEEFLDAGALHV